MITGLPFAVLLIIMIISLTTELKHSYRKHEFNTILKLKRRMDKLDDDIDYR